MFGAHHEYFRAVPHRELCFVQAPSLHFASKVENKITTSKAFVPLPKFKLPLSPPLRDFPLWKI